MLYLYCSRGAHNLHTLLADTDFPIKPKIGERSHSSQGMKSFISFNTLSFARLRNIRRFALNSFKYFIHGKVNDTRRRSNVVHLGTGQLLRKRHCCQISQTGASLHHRSIYCEKSERKQYIRAARVGNTYQYTPLIRESEYKRSFMSGFVRNYFENSYKEMVSFFAKEQKISANDLKDIIDMIEKGKE